LEGSQALPASPSDRVEFEFSVKYSDLMWWCWRYGGCYSSKFESWVIGRAAWEAIGGLESQSYFTTDGQSVSMSWCRAQYGTFDQRYSYYYFFLLSSL
jgi:hypothetical protein